MYEKVFQLKNQPFSISPNVEHYFAAKSFHLALSQCKLAIERGSGPAVVVGGPGTGKTLLLLMLAEDYQQHFRIAQFACSKLDNRLDLLRSLMFSLKQPFRDMAEGELRLAFTEFLQNSEECPNGVLLLIDDAQWLNTGLLDELRILSGISVAGQTRCRVVITGNHCLEESLADPQNDSLNQRIATRNLLSPLSSRETEAYIREHLRRAGGGQREFFTESALQRIHGLSHGIPRMINQVCDAALVACSSSRQPMVDDMLLLKAWQEIEQFPTNWTPNADYFGSNQNQTPRTESVIEFGTLDEFESEPEPEPNHEFESDEQRHDSWSSDQDFPISNVAEKNITASSYVESDLQGIAEIQEIAEIDEDLADEYTQSEDVVSEEAASEDQPNDVYSHPTVRLTVNPFAEQFESEEDVVARIKETCQSLNLSSGNLDKIEVEQALAEVQMPWQESTSTKPTNHPGPEWELGSTSIFLQFESPSLWSGQEDHTASSSSSIENQSESLSPKASEDMRDTSAPPVTCSNDSKSEPPLEPRLEKENAPETLPEDDRDIVVITRPAKIQLAGSEKSEPPAQTLESLAADDDLVVVEKAKGRAVRMDYHELFQQLRQFETH